VDRLDDDSKSGMLARALEFLREGTSVMIFPEGTRSADNNPGFFKRGAFQLAISAAVPILPLVIEGTADILPKHGRIIRGSHRVRLKVLEPRRPEGFGTADPLELGLKFRSLITSELEQMRKEN
jgi:1-acyl-sn-glycerol-3-phosphate acyltransferase